MISNMLLISTFTWSGIFPSVLSWLKSALRRLTSSRTEALSSVDVAQGYDAVCLNSIIPCLFRFPVERFLKGINEKCQETSLIFAAILAQRHSGSRPEFMIIIPQKTVKSFLYFFPQGWAVTMEVSLYTFQFATGEWDQLTIDGKKSYHLSNFRGVV